ncbi:MAG: competence/damage-inducible protein A [bacterium]
MRIGLIIVGDEILSGRRTDKHLPKVVELLGDRGMSLDWVRVVGDDKELLDETLRDSFASGDIVFSTGGIGATPDDLTRESAARALGVATGRHPEGLKILEQWAHETRRELTELRYRLIEFPEGSTLIPNEYNSIPGFSIRDHHFVPGFPEMAWPMIAWVLDNHYAHLQGNQHRERAVMITGVYESHMIPILDEVLAQHPEVKVFCLPIISEEVSRIEAGVKGHSVAVKAAFATFKNLLDEKGYAWERIN